MSLRERFYRERDRRTREFGVDADLFDAPVRIMVGESVAASPRGQRTVLALVNLVARLHRAVTLEVPPVPLESAAMAGGNDLNDACRRLAIAVDPFIQLDHVSGTISLGLGQDAPAGLDVYIGCTATTAWTCSRPTPFDLGFGLTPGSCMAACIGSMALCKLALRMPQAPFEVDAWSQGGPPESIPSPLGVIDVGDVLIVGAGGVGSALAYWARDIGYRGQWAFADGDVAELHNTNRCMAMIAEDAGWPSSPPRNKAEIAARFIGGRSMPVFYDQLDHDLLKPDLVLPLANERSVRHLVTQRGDPILLHATTSSMWEAQLHRHVAGVDDCIVCRMPPRGDSVLFECSKAPIPTKDRHARGDAALPFLSATAGLLLAVGLKRHQFGRLANGPANHWAVCFNDARRTMRLSEFHCGEDCREVLPAEVRRRLVGEARKRLESER